MAHEITFHSFYFAYINNEPNLYDQNNHPDSGYIWTQTTGWQFIPNQCIDDFMLPFQWYRLSPPTTSGLETEWDYSGRMEKDGKARK